MSSNVGSRIRELREKRGMSQIDLARMLDVSCKTISAWENGTRNPKNIHMIAKVFDVASKPSARKEIAALSELSPVSVVSKLATGSQNESVRFRSNNGRFSIEVNGISGDFVDLYCSLHKDNKRFVLECLLNELESE